MATASPAVLIHGRHRSGIAVAVGRGSVEVTTGVNGSAMHDEFGVLAGWRAAAAAELGAEYCVPACCDESADPGVLTWFLDALDVTASRRLLDVGAGTGGPAAFAAQQGRARPVLVEPETVAGAAARRLFGLPVVAGDAQRLPFASGSFAVGWSLAVLCTTRAQRAMLRELARVVHGRIGLLVYVRTVDELPERPRGNDFPAEGELLRGLAGVGLRIVDRMPVRAVSRRPAEWTARAETVERILERRHGTEPAWHRAQDQRRILGRLEDDALIRGLALAVETERGVGRGGR